MMDNSFVACVVVTYNRLGCLKQCLNALRNQSCQQFDIVVVNNGSTDGTTEFLAEQHDVIVIQQENLGGAGGFFAGMKYMMDCAKYSHVWLMDDDGVPDKNELLNLLIGMEEHHLDYANALAIDEKTKTQTCAGEDLSSISSSSTLHNHLYPFNGALYKRSLIEKVGLIKKEMFIWGDEREYTLRVKKAGARCGSITNAIHYHPLFKGNFAYILPFVTIGKISLKPEPMAKFYYRNIGYMDKVYHLGVGRKYILYFFFRCKFSKLFSFIKYYKLGYRNCYDVQI